MNYRSNIFHAFMAEMRKRAKDPRKDWKHVPSTRAKRARQVRLMKLVMKANYVSGSVD